MIAGKDGTMDVNGFSVKKIIVEDQNRRRLPVSVERYPGESSKYGPYVSLVFDAKDAEESIILKGTVTYGKMTYEIAARYVQGKPDDTYFWREDSVSMEVRR